MKASLKIGFANKFFTLWNVRNETSYTMGSNGTYHATGVTTYYDYMGNLAIDESKAIEKAKAKGCTNLIPDTDLYGRRKSFSLFNASNVEIEEGCFKFGWNKGMKINSCDSVKVLVDYGRDYPTEVIERLNEIAPNTYMIHDGNLRKISDVKAEEMSERIWNGINCGEIELEAVSNFSFNDSDVCIKALLVEENRDHSNFNEQSMYGYTFLFKQSEIPFTLVEKFYNGYTYYVPSGKRSFKNTRFRIVNNKMILS